MISSNDLAPLITAIEARYTEERESDVSNA